MVQRIDMGGRGRIDLGTNKGTLSARTVIVTVSTNVLASGRLGFSPSLPQKTLEAANRLSLGTYERIVFELPGNPFRFNADERVIFKTENSRAPMFQCASAEQTLLMPILRDDWALVVGGRGCNHKFYRRPTDRTFRQRHKDQNNKIEVTRWGREPYVLGGFSAAVPGAGGSRRVLMEPIADRVFIAGEAAHEAMWGTVAGAGLSGERAADAALRYLGVGISSGAPAKGSKKR